jgi:DNA adenine methylase
MGKYSCVKCDKTFSQKSHYDKHLTRKNPCEIQTDKIKDLIDKAVEEKLNELNKKLILNHTESINANNTPKMELSKLSKKELLVECDKLGITKCKSKNKDELIKLIISKNDNISNNLNNILIDTSPFIHTTNISPLRYPGGKTRACKIIDDIILQHFDITCFDTILSPFFGGGSFEFYLQNKYGLKLIVNDKFTPLYNFWKQVKVNKTILCEELRKIKSVSKEQFTSYRNTIMDLNDNILQQSIQYFIINRCSFSGSTLSGGFSEEASNKRFTPSSINKIEALDFTYIEIYNNDFYDFINNLTIIKTLIFLDPPYYLESKSKLYGNNGDMHEGFNHQLLFDLLNTKKNWIVTYNNCDYIRTLYKDYIIIDVNWSYGMNTSKSSSEIIIISK